MYQAGFCIPFIPTVKQVCLHLHLTLAWTQIFFSDMAYSSICWGCTSA